MTFAERLKAFRTAAGISCAALADAAGVSRMAVTLLERGSRQPSLETAERLAIALGRTLRDFEGCTAASKG